MYQTPGGAGASVSKSGIYKHLSDGKVWRRVGRAGVGGEDTAAGTMDYKTMLEPAVGL